MAKAPAEEPRGLLVQAGVITRHEESALLEQFESLRWDPIVIRGQAARRTARHFGLSYDYDSRSPRPGEPISAWLEPPREAAAELAGVSREELAEILVQRYPAGSTIGWHRDAPAFGIVVGISLLGEGGCGFNAAAGKVGGYGRPSSSRAPGTSLRASPDGRVSTRSLRPVSCAIRSRSER